MSINSSGLCDFSILISCFIYLLYSYVKNLKLYLLINHYDYVRQLFRF